MSPFSFVISSGPSVGSFPSLSSSDERTNHFGTCQSRSDTSESETDQRPVQSGRRGINFLVQTADGSGLPYILFFKDKYFDQAFSKKLRFFELFVGICIARFFSIVDFRVRTEGAGSGNLGQAFSSIDPIAAAAATLGPKKTDGGKSEKSEFRPFFSKRSDPRLSYPSPRCQIAAKSLLSRGRKKRVHLYFLFSSQLELSRVSRETRGKRRRVNCSFLFLPLLSYC